MEASSRSRFARLTTGAVLASALAASPGRAQDATDASEISGPRVAVEVQACAGLEPEIVRRILGIELGSDADLDALPTDPRASRARASCPDVAPLEPGAEGQDAEVARVLLVVDEPLTGKHLERTIDLGGSPSSGRSRLVALALAELLAASWIELGMRREPEIVVVGTEDDEEARAVALEIARTRMPIATEAPADEAPVEAVRPRAFGVRAFGTARVSGEPLHVSGGGGLGVDLELLAPLAITVDARAEQGSVDVADLGTVRLTAAWVTGLVALRLPLELHHADFGIGARVGYGWLDGEGERGVGGAQQSGALVALVTASHISLHVVGSAYLHVGIELGWVTLPVFGTNAITGESVARIDGLQLAITFGFEVRPE